MSAFLFLLVLACGGGSTLPQADRRGIVMQPGEGPGDRADQIAGKMIEPIRGEQTRVLNSADHVASITLPGRKIDFVFSDVLWRGINNHCLVMWTEEVGSGSHGTSARQFCDEELPGIDLGAVHDNSTGNFDEEVRSLLLLVPPETLSVQVITTTGVTFTVFPAGGLAYVEWPAERGEGVRVVGLDADGEELWSHALPYDGP